MDHGRNANTALAAIILLLSPVMLICCIPLTGGSGLDVFAGGDAVPALALALCAPTLVVLRQYLRARAR